MNAEARYFISKQPGSQPRLILDEIPHEMSGERTVANGTSTIFPDTVFKNNQNKPFRIDRVRIDITCFDNQATPVAVTPAQMQTVRDAIGKYVRIGITDIDASQPLTKANTLVAALVNRRSWTWEWRTPYDLENGGSFQVVADNILANFAIGQTTVANLRIEITFEGRLLVLG